MKYYTDGYTEVSNPSDTGGGYSILDESGNKIVHEVIKKEGLTNNEAELLGVHAALELAKEGDSISTDSMTILTWINGGKSKARPDLNVYLVRAKQLKTEKKINLLWEGRDFNLAGHYNEKFDTAVELAKFHKTRVKEKTKKKKMLLAEKIAWILKQEEREFEEIVDDLVELVYADYNNEKSKRPTQTRIEV